MKNDLFFSLTLKNKFYIKKKLQFLFFLVVEANRKAFNIFQMLSNQLREPVIHFTVFHSDKTPEISPRKTSKNFL